MVSKWTCVPHTAPDSPSGWTMLCVLGVCAGEAQKLCLFFNSREVNQILPEELPNLMPAEVIPSLNSGFKETPMMDKEWIIYFIALVNRILN